MGEGSAQPEDMGCTGAAPDAAAHLLSGHAGIWTPPWVRVCHVFDFLSVLVTGNMR